MVTLVLSSCTTIKHTSSTATVENSVVALVMADMDVQPTKISKTMTWDYNPFKRVDINILKSNTTAQMLKEAGADALVEPEYVIEKRGFMRGGSLTITGFPAKYKNFHKMTSEEAEIIKALRCSDPESRVCYDQKEHKHKKCIW